MSIEISASVVVCLFCMFFQLLILAFQIGIFVGQKGITTTVDREKL